MPAKDVPCYCPQCKGELIPRSTRVKHEAKQLRLKGVLCKGSMSMGKGMYAMARTLWTSPRPLVPQSKGSTSTIENTSHALFAPISRHAPHVQGGPLHTKESSPSPRFVTSRIIDVALKEVINIQLPNASSSVPARGWHANSTPLAPLGVLLPPLTPASLPPYETPNSWGFHAQPPDLPHAPTSPVLSKQPNVRLDTSEDHPEPICDDDWELEMEPNGQDGQDENIEQAEESARNEQDGLVEQVAEQDRQDTPAEMSGDCEETADPFAQDVNTSARNSFSLSRCDWHPAVLLTCILAGWLHLAGHLPFRFCDVMLSVICHILRELGHSSLLSEMRVSLSGVLSSLHLNVPFQIFPCCPECRMVYPESVLLDLKATCTGCKTPLFTFEGNQFRRARRKLSFPYLSLTAQLQSLLQVAENEDNMEAWKKRPRVLGRLVDMFDGLICRILKGPDGLPFFKYGSSTEDDGELRVGVALGLDWFSYLRSLISASYTSCPMSFTIVNFPAYLRCVLS
ncbi:hypothetical protein C8Q76DRAFT_297174 [Earliella scabrosa]|nr:hypothetical protein C8Q76DRAFT_297174 [Earliella scabrosa]